MFCTSGAGTLAAAAETRPPPLMATHCGSGEAQVTVSIPAGFHLYSNGNGESSLEENCVNPQNPTPNPRSPARGEETVYYRECQRNHAVNMGGYAVDGCGEFMADEEDVLKCGVCGCHRNFHRRETKGEESPPPCEFCALRHKRRASSSSAPGSPLSPPYYTPPLLQAPHFNPDSDDPDNNSNYPQTPMRKRFRTKFSQEQKEKMYLFAEKVGWRMQKQDEVAVQQFCNEIGVEKGVLKVWMHNNKHTLGKKP